MDVARSALRLGAGAATVLALEEREAMPALAVEVAQALAEGVRIVNRAGVRGFVHGGTGVTGIVVGRARLGRAADGSVGPVFESEERSVVNADTVVLAIGQRPDPAVLSPAVGAARDLLAAAPSGATSDPRVFAGGDATSSHRTVADALGAGTRAARAIHASLSGERRVPFVAPHAGAELRREHVVAAVEIGRHQFALAPRAQRSERPAAARVASFVEVVHGLGEAAARAEAARCFTCGRCIDCDICLGVCPDMAISRAGEAYHVSLEHCKGCGLCAAECPRGALAMVSER
jgi:NADPH-dependent glutamate synthase beta subunit-like oxidoreductase